MLSQERRLAPRRELTVPLRFHAGASLESETLIGETVNLSEHGVYFTVNQMLTVGTPLEMFFVIPQELTGRRAEEVRCTGRVVHVHPGIGSNGLTGIGAQIEHFEPAALSHEWTN